MLMFIGPCSENQSALMRTKLCESANWVLSLPDVRNSGFLLYVFSSCLTNTNPFLGLCIVPSQGYKEVKEGNFGHSPILVGRPSESKDPACHAYDPYILCYGKNRETDGKD